MESLDTYRISEGILKMKLTVVGSGYVGLVSGVCLAKVGHDVTCVDINPDIVERLNRGEPHIYEIGLEDALSDVLSRGLFRAQTDLDTALDDCELVLIAVGTPSHEGAIDLQYIGMAARQIGEYIAKNNQHISVVVKSTVIPGTTDTYVRGEIEKASGKSFPAFGLGMNPEFLREGNALEDFATPDRIVLGADDERTKERLTKLYAPWDVDKVYVNSRTAELSKYANNCLLALQISAMNEIANLSARLSGIDALDVVKIVGLDKRWSPILEDGTRITPQITTYHTPGCGFGGSCFPKDVQAIHAQGKALGLPMHILNAILDVNNTQPKQVVSILNQAVGPISNKNILILGLAFKPGTDDVRETASLPIVNDLLAHKANISAHDPIATKNFQQALGDNCEFVDFTNDWQDKVEGADIIIVATRWPEYDALKKCNLVNKIVFDARRMFDPSDFEDSTYLTIGRRLL